MPNQVVDFLNKMYSTTDEIIDQDFVHSQLEMYMSGYGWMGPSLTWNDTELHWEQS